MTKYEYKIVTLDRFDHDYLHEKKLNELGKDGWELVSVCDTEHIGTKAYLKRPYKAAFHAKLKGEGE